MVERIRFLLVRFAEDEKTVRELAATDASFDALCDEYGKLIKVLHSLESEIEMIRRRRAWLEEELLTRIEGYQPH